MAGVASPLFLSVVPLRAQPGALSMQGVSAAQYDLLIKGGKVIDPLENLEGTLDMAIKAGKIARLERDIPPNPNQSHQVLSAEGMIVTPGLTGLHAHAFPYVQSSSK
jgi:predicted amidohydrolase